MGWKGTERQCGNGPHTSVLMDINNFEIRSLFTKLSLESHWLFELENLGVTQIRRKPGVGDT